MALVVLSKHDICFAQMHRLFCLNMTAGALCVIMVLYIMYVKGCGGQVGRGKG